jgi:predicted ArsR family transcriptional regulator
MLPTPDARFWASTKGRIILMLRKDNRTVNEIAQALALTDNAVRSQLTGLERDGLVQPSGSRPGRRKPNVVYGLTAKAENLFPKVYGLVLRFLLDVIKERNSAKDMDELLTTVGHRLAPKYRVVIQAGQAGTTVEQAITVLRDFGGFCEQTGGNGKVVLRCFDCPLAVAVVGHPEICRLMETVLGDALGVPVHQHCQAEPSPQCHFEIETGAS